MSLPRQKKNVEPGSPRPFNSLRKKDDVVELWRRSWGSGQSAQSQSSASLQSSATNFSSAVGKDDFWAALQTNYNYIMDTNLLESCQEATGEIEDSTAQDDVKPDSKRVRQLEKVNQDPRTLRRWLREMETRLARIPTHAEAKKLPEWKIQALLKEHGELYREVVSQARNVAACIRQAKGETEAQEQEQDEPKSLERRYHFLYLKAIEAQCVLESLLDRQKSPSPESSSTDDEPVQKQPKLGDSGYKCLSDAFEADSEGSDPKTKAEELNLSIQSSETTKPNTVKKNPAKFNRSNRKSDNCATFYFKHPDTDGTPLSPPSSEEEEWIFTAQDETDAALVDSTPLSTTGAVIETEVQLAEERTNKISMICVTRNTKESIQKLVLGAESLVRDDTTTILRAEALPASTSSRMSIATSVRTCGEDLLPGPKHKRVQEWLEHQPLAVSGTAITTSISSEESGGISSEGITDSQATCVQSIDSSPAHGDQSASSKKRKGKKKILPETPQKVNGGSDMDEPSTIKKPDFKIGSVTKVYGQQHLGALAALSNYNNDKSSKEKTSPERNTAADEQLSSFEQSWDNYQEKYMSEPYSEDLDKDAAKRLLEFGDDYRAFLDSHSDCCSSLSAAQLDHSISPPRPVRTPSDMADSSLETRRRRLRELNEFERRRKLLAEAPKKAESETNGRRRSLRKRNPSSGDSNSDNDEEFGSLLSQSRTRLENVQALRIRQHLLRVEDFREISATCRENSESLETLLRADLSEVRGQQVRELLGQWKEALEWSESFSGIRELQEEAAGLKGALLRLGTQSHSFDSEEAIETAISELQADKKSLLQLRGRVLNVDGAIHRWISGQKGIEEAFVEQLRKAVLSLYTIWDEAEARVESRLDNLESSLAAWKEFENGLSELRETLDHDRDVLVDFKDALDAESEADEEIFARLLQENDIQSLLNETFSSPASDSGISEDSGAVSERERRLRALRRLAKQLESALTPDSSALKVITQRMQAAETELRTLQDTCRDLMATVSHSKFLEMNAKSPINVQIPIISIKRKGKRRAKRRSGGIRFDEAVGGVDVEDEDKEEEKPVWWLWRFLKIFLPIQFLLLLFLWAMMTPNCCDRSNNFRNSFQPSLRYVRGPPPI